MCSIWSLVVSCRVKMPVCFFGLGDWFVVKGFTGPHGFFDYVTPFVCILLCGRASEDWNNKDRRQEIPYFVSWLFDKSSVRVCHDLACFVAYSHTLCQISQHVSLSSLSLSPLPFFVASRLVIHLGLWWWRIFHSLLLGIIFSWITCLDFGD